MPYSRALRQKMRSKMMHSEKEMPMKGRMMMATALSKSSSSKKKRK